MSRLIAIAFFAAAAWGLIVEGNLSAGLSRGAAGPRKHKFCAGGDEYRDELQRHGIGRWEDLQLPGPGNECREETRANTQTWRVRRQVRLRSVLTDRAKRRWVVAEKLQMADTDWTATPLRF